MIHKYFIQNDTGLIQFVTSDFTFEFTDTSNGKVYIFDDSRIVLLITSDAVSQYVDLPECKRLNPYWEANHFWSYTGQKPRPSLQGDYTDFTWPNVLKVSASRQILYFQGGWSQDFSISIPNHNNPFIGMMFEEDNLDHSYYLQREADTNQLKLYIKPGDGTTHELLVSAADLAGQVVRFLITLNTSDKEFLSGVGSSRIQLGWKAEDGTYGVTEKFTGDFLVGNTPVWGFIGGSHLYQNIYSDEVFKEEELVAPILSRLSIAPGFNAKASTLIFDNTNVNLPGDDITTIQKAIGATKSLIDNQPLQTSVATYDDLPSATDNPNGIVHVVDASGDSTVTSGWAKYQSIDGTWFNYLAQEDLSASVTALTPGQLADTTSEVQGTVSGKTVNDLITSRVGNTLEEKLDKPSSVTEGYLPFVDSTGNDIEWKELEIPNASKYKGTVATEEAIKALTEVEDGEVYYVTELNNFVVFDADGTEGLYKPNTGSGVWVQPGKDPEVLYKTWETLSDPLVSNERFVVTGLSGGVYNLDPNKYYDFIVGEDIAGEAKGTTLNIDEINRYSLIGTAEEENTPFIKNITLALFTKAYSSFGIFHTVNFYDKDGNKYPNEVWKCTSASVQPNIGRYAEKVSGHSGNRRWTYYTFEYIGGDIANGLSAVEASYRGDFESIYMAYVYVTTTERRHTIGIGDGYTFLGRVKIPFRSVDFISDSYQIAKLTQHDSGLTERVELENKRALQAFLEFGKSYSIPAGRYYDGYWATITNTTSVTKGITFSGFQQAFFRDSSSNSTISSPFNIPGNTTYRISVSKIDNEKFLHVMPYGGSGQTSSIALLDEDDMASNSASAAPTQQSVKAYVDTKVSEVPIQLLPTPEDGSILVYNTTTEKYEPKNPSTQDIISWQPLNGGVYNAGNLVENGESIIVVQNISSTDYLNVKNVAEEFWMPPNSNAFITKHDTVWRCTPPSYILKKTFTADQFGDDGRLVIADVKIDKNRVSNVRILEGDEQVYLRYSVGTSSITIRAQNGFTFAGSVEITII